MNRATQASLLVFPNKWHQVDKFCNPAGIVACDPEGHSPDNRKIGASLESTDVIGTFEPGDLRKPRQHNYWQFDVEPTWLPVTAYYIAEIRKGTLFAANEATAFLAGVPFVDPSELENTSHVAAKVSFEILYGKGAWVG